MQTYKQFKPTGFDCKGLGLEDRQDWLVSLSRNRDSDTLTESNFAVALDTMGGESDTVEVHRFGHWACEWFEIILVCPGTSAAKEAEEIEAALADYPVLDDTDFSEREQAEADQTWANCYSNTQRIAYIRNASRGQFEFRSFADLMGCVRGKYFAGYASDLLS